MTNYVAPCVLGLTAPVHEIRHVPQAQQQYETAQCSSCHCVVESMSLSLSFQIDWSEKERERNGEEGGK